MGPTCIERGEKRKGLNDEKEEQGGRERSAVKGKIGSGGTFYEKTIYRGAHASIVCTTNVIATMLAVFTRSRPLFRWIYTKSIKIWNM